MRLQPKSELTTQVVEDTLSLCGARLRKGFSWTPERKKDAYDWAMREHMAASDNRRMKRVSMPKFLQA